MNELKETVKARLKPLSTLASEFSLGEGFLYEEDAHDGPSDDKHAAVLIVCIEGAETEVLFTIRAHDMRHHAGQVSLPGGRYAPGEHFPLETALREAEEEVGISPSKLEVLGGISPIETSTGFRVIPVVAWTEATYSFKPCDREVAGLFTLPLSHLLSQDSYSSHRLTYRVRGERRTHRIWRVRSHQWPIWGATALILAKLAGFTESER